MTTEPSLPSNEPKQEVLDDLFRLQSLGHQKTVLPIIQTMLVLYPNSFSVYYALGNSQSSLQLYDLAINSYKKAIEIKPDLAEAYNNLGNCLGNSGRLDEAIDSFKQAIAIKPRYAEAFFNMGEYLNSEEAVDSYKKAIELKPDFAEAYVNLGNLLRLKGELKKAIDSFKQAININPDFVEAYTNMGIALQDNGELDPAIDSYKQAIRIWPDYSPAHLNLAYAFLNAGNVKEGLKENEWRLRTPDFKTEERHFSQPMWNGIESLGDKTILLWNEQGPGDVIMWSSCISYLSSRTAHCILECQEKLVPLLARSLPSVEVKVAKSRLDGERTDFDLHLPLGSLFQHFISEISQNTNPDAFLVPNPLRVDYWIERLNSLGSGPFIGMSWTSPRVTPQRLRNYTQLSDWAPIFALPNVTLVSLQSSDFGNDSALVEDLSAIQDEFGITVHYFNELDYWGNLDDVSALCAALDIVVSVSTAVSTLAAGVGTPTKMLHWRQSAWNNILFTPPGPSVDVFERNTWEPWDTVFQSVAKDIADFQVT